MLMKSRVSKSIMKITGLNDVFRAWLFLFVLAGSVSSAFQQSVNIITSPNQSIRLRNWQIAKDLAPKNTFHNPSDSLWLPFSSAVDISKYEEGNWIIRTEIIIDDSVDKEITWGLFFTYITTAYEVYWDGLKVAQNGIIGINNADENAGKYEFHIMLPASLVSTGKHTIIVRLSNYHNYTSWKWFYGGCLLGPYDAELKNIYQKKYKSVFIIGILFIPFLLNLFLYFAREKRTEHLLFSLICFIVILDASANLISTFIDISALYVHWEYSAYQIITLVFTSLFPAFFVYLFSFPKKIIGFIIALNLVIYFFFTSILTVFSVMSLTVLVICSMIALLALQQRREGSIIILIGLIAAWGAYYFDFAFAGLATVMVLCTSISFAKQFGKKEKTEREAQLRSAHLENELLKKNINPHFLLNTLTSIIAYLRKNPKSAIKLIEALAEEFRMILQISTLKQIPIQQEIALCKAHLNIMSYRKGADYRMETAGIVEEEHVPPMIFHTLIENGLTHGYENKMQGTFTLQRIKKSHGVHYVLSHDGDFSSDESKDSSGFGMRYIKGRLEESYPDRWNLISRRQPGGWETIIEIREI
jgi:hypothetical protein